MPQVVVYLDPDQDLDIQRQRLRHDHPDAVVLEEHIGGLKTAQLSADQLSVPLVAAESSPDQGSRGQQPHHLARRRKSQERYEALRPVFRQAELLGYSKLTEIAKYLNELEHPLPSGRPGIWTASQVKRARAWLSK